MISSYKIVSTIIVALGVRIKYLKKIKRNIHVDLHVTKT